MRRKVVSAIGLTAGSALMYSSAAAAADKPTVDAAALAKAIETLKTFDWGGDRKALNPIDDAVAATHGDAAARKALEKQLLDVLKGGAPRGAQDYILRTLRTIGSPDCVPVLAPLLTDKDLSHMARYALERNSAPQAAAALRAALPKTTGALKVGIIGSLGARGDTASVPALAALLTDSDQAVAAAAALALGSIGTAEAGAALAKAVTKAPEAIKPAVTDACLVCAEKLLAEGKRADAAALYKAVDTEGQPRHVRLAAARGRLLAAGKKETP
jgi:HEAT repeat protein